MTDRLIVCSGCERQIEACSFCESEACEDPICYRCLIVDLGETIMEPHGHGG